MTRVLVVRGHLVNPWELRPWALLPDRFEVSALVTGSNVFDTGSVPLDQVRVRSRRDFLPRGRLGDVAMGLFGRPIPASRTRSSQGADIVHAAELSFWFAGEMARLKAEHGFKLVLTVWETIPFLDDLPEPVRAHLPRADARGRRPLPGGDRAGARRRCCSRASSPNGSRCATPGIDIERFSAAARPDPPPTEHVVISPGRLVWEKGHQDVMRALAAIKRGLVPAPAGARPRLLIVGSGPEEGRLRAYADELGLGQEVEFRSVPYDEMPALYARASCMVLASLATRRRGLLAR